MAVRKLFYEDSHLARFTARVTGCVQGDKGWEVTLSQTAFYPEGGGQAADTGILGGVKVLDTRERGEDIVHFCGGPLEIGSQVAGEIDYAPRFLRMQQHSGEHIVSGLIHARYGWHNTGFHMGKEATVIDFDGEIPPEALPELEAAANRAVWANLPIRCWYPSPEELPTVSYRTKKALPWPVRIVEVPGIDTCACCGTHVAATGEIGLIKLFSAVRFRGGTRIEMACGSLALDILNTAHGQNKLVSQAFSAQTHETGAAAERMNALLAEQKYRLVSLQRKLFAYTAASYAGKGNVLHFEEGLDGNALRELAEAIGSVCGGRAAVFTPTEVGHSYCLCSETEDLRPFGKSMTQALNGRGGGKPNCQQGRVGAAREEIEAFFGEI